ncbi:rod shape-determining protein MreC [Patulibacter minatonensis]|uniref:rod shape-determining protein MreC n=1 Tax=Patulibacter minatonensis TaxID=298163 RepID=UPI000478CB54|nr:rod shape-determining protein MreC [Patulibacter minatonensis]
MIDPAARRRRRLILAALVAVCLVLITAGFGAAGGASGGPLGALGEGGSKIAKPARDLVHWVGDTADAKGENQDLKKDAAQLRAENARLNGELRKFPNMQCLSNMVDSLKLQRNDPLPANVIGKSPTAWATTITIDQGTAQGVQDRQAVVGAAGEGAGLVGFVSGVRLNNATVSLLPSQDVAVGAYLPGVKPVLTVRGAGAGTLSDLELEFVPSTSTIKQNALVYTSGTVDDTSKFPSNAPPYLPIGRITSVSDRRTDEQIGHIKPLVDLQTLEDVQVLRRVVNGNRASGARPTGRVASCPSTAQPDRGGRTTSGSANRPTTSTGTAATTTGSTPATTGENGATGGTGTTTPGAGTTGAGSTDTGQTGTDGATSGRTTTSGAP